MASAVDITLLAMTWLMVKHAVADFVLQTDYQWRNKGTYGHPGGLIHAGIHLLGTAPVLLLVPSPTAAIAASVLAGEYVIHYHIDWVRDRLNRIHGWTHADSAYWHVMGYDQLAHGLTYVGIVWVLLKAGAAA